MRAPVGTPALPRPVEPRAGRHPYGSPTDLTRPYPDDIEDLLDGVLDPTSGCAPDSLATSDDAPPFMIVHGEEDALVEQAHLLHEALIDMGALGTDRLGTCRMASKPSGTPTPSMDQVLAMMLTFLAKMSVSPSEG